MSTSRDHGLDAARAGAMLGVVVVHACAAYVVTPIGWAVTDESATVAADLILWIGRSFLMPAFFLLAGHLSRRTLARRGVTSFLRGRSKRLVLPLLLFIVPVSMAMNGLWDWGRALSARDAVASTVPALERSDAPLTLAHLWYLYYLILYSLLAVLAWWGRDRLAVLPRWLVLPLVVAGVAVPLLPSAQLQLDTPLGFAIDPWFALTYGAFFAWGAVLSLDALRRRTGAWAGVAAVAFAVVLPDLIASADGEPPRLHAQLASALFSVAMTAAVTGALLRMRRWPRHLESLARSSYWTYIVHLPLVVLLQIGFLAISAPAGVEVALIVGASGTVALCTHWLFIRPTILARLVG